MIFISAIISYLGQHTVFKSSLIVIFLFFAVDGNVKMQQKISLTKSVDKTVVIDCNFPSDCSGYIHWYQLKEGQTLRRILYSSISGGATNNDAGFESFKIDRKPSNLALKIPQLKNEHSAVYYCACCTIRESTN
uniref:Immunoglobulin V-set domain-containing protein n=1 Tax=Sinocyclocheilus grahami TaxID=75366 RepID=A0A672NB22_SINGR